MKQKIAKKLTLNKNTVAYLDRHELGEVHGGSVIIQSCKCTESCSLIIICCDTTTPKEKMINSGTACG